MDYQFHNQFVFRTPLLPISNSKFTESDLLTFSKQTFFKEAIYLASPALYNDMLKWHRNEIVKPKEKRKIIISLYKYYTRMSTRCTPFGLFAGCGCGKWEETEQKIVLEKKVRRHTRLDMNYLGKLVEILKNDSEIVRYLKFYPNNSIYVLGNKIRYTECRYINGRKNHEISSVDFDEALKLVLLNANNGSSIRDLAKLLISEYISDRQAETYIRALIENQILVSNIEPTITGKEFIYVLIQTLKSANIGSNSKLTEVIHFLDQIQDHMTKLDKAVENDVVLYNLIFQLAKSLDDSCEEKYLFQSDLYKECQNSVLNSDWQAKILEVVNFLNYLNFPTENANLKFFKDKFRSRYEDQELPLLEVLDTESGIGYLKQDIADINEFIDDIILPQRISNQLSISWGIKEDILLKKLINTIKEGERICILTDEEFGLTGKSQNVLPDTLGVLFKLPFKNKLQFIDCGGASAANLLSRFAHGNEGIKALINDIANHENDLNPEHIIAEIVHLPENRAGNILLRPIIRQFEIPYLCRSILETNKQIELKDLMVSVRNNRIVLRSQKFDKEILPRLSTAHNYASNSLPLYHFLCDLQGQNYGSTGLAFSWGPLSSTFKFLPRVEYKNAILFTAKWQLDKSDFRNIFENEMDSNAINDWRKKFQIPDCVSLTDGDNKLLIDFNDPLSIQMFTSILKNRSRIKFEEFLFDSRSAAITNTEGHGYTNEFIAVLLKKNQGLQKHMESDRKRVEISEKQNRKRKIVPGENWIYYKFYCGTKTADNLLNTIIKPLTERLLKLGLIEKYFYVRYFDKYPHLRIRFLVKDTSKIGEIIKIIHRKTQYYSKSDIIHKIQIDTYDRELERYGPKLIELSESIFYYDSKATLVYLNNNQSESSRWKFAIRSVDELLDNFNFTLDEKYLFIQILRNKFVKEHGNEKAIDQQLNKKFRKIRNELKDIFQKNEDEYKVINKLMKVKSLEISPIAKSILNLKSKQSLQVNLNELISSYLHMMINRLFRSKQRTYEMVIYDILSKYYRIEMEVRS